MAQTWNFGTPKRGEAHPQIKDVRVQRNGRTWTASYHVEGGKLNVWGAWGSRSEPVGRTKDLKKRAEALLTNILDQQTG